MISIAAVDLDDTLVRSDGTISDRTLATIQAWQEDGREMVIATGRPPRSTREIPDELHRLHWICYNGSIVQREGEVLYEEYISAEETEWIVDQFLNANADLWLGIESGDTLFINHPFDRPGVTHVPDLLAVARVPAAKVLLRLDAYRQIEELLGELPTSVRVLISERYNLVQVMPGRASKAAALQQLVETWDQSLDDVVAFGDDTNDVEMIQEAGLGVAMGNAVPEVISVADWVTATHDEDGVAQVLEAVMNETMALNPGG